MLNEFSKLGNHASKIELASYYLNKQYGLNDLDKAIKLYEEEAKIGNEVAKLNLGIIYYAQNKFDLAFKYLNDDSLKSNEIALCLLGDLYKNGRFVDKDLNKAFDCFFKSAEKNYSTSQIQLGEFYYFGLGIDKDYKKAFYYYMEAYKNGEKEVCYQIGRCYEFGNGINQNDKEALFWYNKAKDFNSPKACCRLGKVYLNGELGENKNLESGFMCVLKGSKLNDPDSIFLLATSLIMELEQVQNIV